MDETWKRRITGLLDAHRTLRLATLRPDGWPQVTTVGYANDGLDIYFLCGKDSQKAANLARDDRVSAVIDDDQPQVMRIEGLSLAAHAVRVTDPHEGARAIARLFARYPPQEGVEAFPIPDPADVALFRLEPTVVSVLDYAKGFGHADLVACTPQTAPAPA
jgi:nitroimidazol reductase NimA-like FMN-containing flavoprotein (pyridoxamine 5'-phosphate oxidase superfamily)